jgi:catechol 2,3-dioxygenase-like lactoylglutathione lyase family enzyme
VRVIQLPGGSAIELTEFAPSEPLAPVVAAAARVAHTCVWVEDVAEGVRRVIANGGAQQGEIVPWHGYQVTMVEDPDGHVIELVDIDLQTATSVMSSDTAEWKGIRIELVQQATAV